MGLLKGAGIITLAVMIVCALAGVATVFALFGASMAFLFIGGLFVMLLINLVMAGLRKFFRGFLAKFQRKHRPI